MESRNARQLAAELRGFLPGVDQQATLEALLAKAEYQEQVCDVCHAAAVEEGKRQVEEARA